MAREFDRSSSEYLRHSGAVLTAVPITMACWFNVLDITNQHFLMCLVDYSDPPGHFFALTARGDQTGDRLRADSYGGGAGVWAETSIAYTVSTWQHGCAIFVTSTDRRVYLDGGSKGVNNNPDTPSNLDWTSIGTLYRSDNPGTYVDGSIAEAAMWNAVLTDAEVAVLATGIRPIMVRPQNIVAYWPLVRDQDYDIVGGYDMTPINAPTISAHPPIIYGAVFPNAAPAGAASPSISPSASVSPSASESPSVSPSASESPSASISPSASVSPSSSESPSPSPSPADMEVVWGHDTGVLEGNVRDFQFNWTGTGTIENPGVNDTERLALEAGEDMISEVVNTGTTGVEVLYNVYAAGDAIDLDYRHGATVAACEGAGWNNYVGPFVSLGFIQVRTTSTL